MRFGKRLLFEVKKLSTTTTTKKMDDRKRDR